MLTLLHDFGIFIILLLVTGIGNSRFSANFCSTLDLRTNPTYESFTKGEVIKYWSKPPAFFIHRMVWVVTINRGFWFSVADSNRLNWTLGFQLRRSLFRMLVFVDLIVKLLTYCCLENETWLPKPIWRPSNNPRLARCITGPALLISLAILFNCHKKTSRY